MAGPRQGGPPFPGTIGTSPTAPAVAPGRTFVGADLGPGHPGASGQSIAQSALNAAASSGDPAAQAVAAATGIARVRNCKATVGQFAAPSNPSLGAGQLWGFRQQVLPANADRKLLGIGSPWTHGNPPGPYIVYAFPGNNETGFAVLFQPGPVKLTAIASVNELNSYLPQAFVPLIGGSYQGLYFDVPPTNPVTIICWQYHPIAGGYGLDINCNILEGV
jgi:hypothetical protein